MASAVSSVAETVSKITRSLPERVGCETGSSDRCNGFTVLIRKPLVGGLLTGC